MITSEGDRDDYIARQLGAAEHQLNAAHEQAKGAFGGPSTCLLASIAHSLYALALMLGLDDDDG